MQDQITAFVDTNILLHCQPIDQIPWPKQLGAATVVIRLAAAVVSELNKHKDGHPADHIRERARKVLAKIHDIVVDGGGHVADGVRLECDTVSASPDWSGMGFDSESQDDRILASVLSHIRERAPSEVVLVTGDLGFSLKAHSRGIRTCRLPENLQIPPRPDARQKRIAELEAKLREVERSSPHLAVSSPDGWDRVNLQVKPAFIVPQGAAEQYVATHIMPRFTRRPESLPSTLGDKLVEDGEMPPVGEALLQLAKQVGHALAVNHNLAVDHYLAQYTRYATDWWAYENRARLRHRLDLHLRNDGGVPGEDINLFLRIPGTLMVFPTGQVPTAPAPPPPPVRMRQGQTRRPTPAPVTAPKESALRYVQGARSGQDWELQYRLPRLNQHLMEPIHNLFVEYRAHDQVHPFSVAYRIVAVNSAEQWTGVIHVDPTPQPTVGAPRATRRFKPGKK